MANNNGAFFNHGWYIDDISVTASFSELTPPKITMKPPVVQDTVFYTGPFDIYAWITDASGIDTAYLDYQVNSGPHIYLPMVLVSDSTYKGTIPTYTYNNQIDYHVHAEDNSAAHNTANGTNQWFYVKKAKAICCDWNWNFLFIFIACKRIYIIIAGVLSFILPQN